MKILITGSAGFIGYSFAYFLCKKFKNYNIYGIDNFSDYYSVKFKKKRINNLKKFKNFNFKKVDISKKKNLEKIFRKQKLTYVFNFAAQAGVRYSLKDPKSYMDSNINGFFNVIEMVKKYKIKRLFYASSSSIYGEKKKFPTKENDKSNPINIYSLSKTFNESIAEIYSKLHNVNSTGLRFFTVYGKWGRPDMFLFKIFKSILNKSVFELNNKGDHYRDFTYIDDINHILCRLLILNKNNPHEIYNVCSGNTVNIQKIINLFNKNNNLKYKNVSRNIVDLYKTHGSNKKLIKKVGRTKFTNINSVIYDIFSWYKKNRINKIT